MQAELSIDKTNWPRGPWDTEPDRDEWRDEATGLPCLIVRVADSGHLCGYVAVPPGHPLHGVRYGDESPALAEALERRKSRPIGEHPAFAVTIACLFGGLSARPDTVFEVHGGITYSDACAGHICHEPLPGEPDNVWWFGFDCSHCDDLSRFSDGIDRNFSGAYRDFAYVKAECARLAKQLAEIK